MSFPIFSSSYSPFALHHRAVTHVPIPHSGTSVSACLGSIRYARSSTRSVRANAYRECTCQLAGIHADVTSPHLFVRYACVCVFLSVYVIYGNTPSTAYIDRTHGRRWRAAYVITTGARRV